MGPKEGLRTEIFWTLAETRKILTRKMDGLGKENQIVIAERIDWMIKEIQRWKDSLKEATENAEVIAHPRSPLAPGDLATADSRFPSYNVLPALPPSSLRSNGPRNLRDACWPPLFDTVSPTSATDTAGVRRTGKVQHGKDQFYSSRGTCGEDDCK